MTVQGVGPYALVNPIGAGSMGRVFMAQDRRSGELVAVKALSSAAQGEALYRLKREFRLAQSLSSRHLVPIYDLYTEDETAYLAMPLLRGVPLDQWLCDRDKQRPHLGSIVHQVLAGLADLHGAGLVHRDIKPSNIMVEPDCTVVLLDYGLAERHGVDALLRFPCHELAGTVAFLAPEAVFGAPPRASQDLFAVGVVAYEAIVGGLPPRDRLSWEVAEDRARDELRASWPDIPSEVFELVGDLLRTDPRQRPTAREAIARISKQPAEPGRTKHEFFVGRDVETQRVGTALKEQQVVAVLGASGIGKTSLVERVVAQLRTDDIRWRVLATRCHPGEQVRFRTLDALVDELSRWLRRRPLTPDDALSSVEIATLSSAFPVLREALGSGIAQRPVPADPEERWLRTCSGLARLIEKLGEEHHLLLWIDDVHWGDDDGLRLLWGVIDHLGPAMPALVISGWTVPNAFADRDGVLRVVLEPLQSGDARRLAVHHAGMASVVLDENQLASFVQATAGIPALIEFLAQEGEVGFGRLSLEDLVVRRVETLDEPATELLVSLALVARPLPLSTVRELTVSAQPRRVLAALERTKLVRRIPSNGTECLEVAHDRLLRAVRYLRSDTHPGLHLRLAEQFERDGAVAAEVVAQHWRWAGQNARARSLWMQAGEDACRASAYDHAASCFRDALSVSEEADRLLPLQRWAQAQAYAGRPLDAARTFESAARASGADFDAEVRQAAVHYLLAGDLDRGLALTRRSFRRLGERLPRSRLQIYARLIWLRWQRTSLARTTSTAVSRKRHIEIADFAFSTATSLLRSDPALAAYIQDLHVRHALRSGCPQQSARALAFRAGIDALQGPARASADVDEIEVARHLLADRPEPRFEALVNAAKAGRTWSAGAWADCIAWAEEAQRLAEADCVGARWELGLCRSLILDAMRWSGRYAELRESMRRYLADAGLRGDRYTTVTLHARFSSTLALVDDIPHAAVPHIEAGRAWNHEARNLQSLAVIHAQVEYLLYTGRSEEALRFVDGELRALRFAPILQLLPPRAKLFQTRGACRLAVACRRRESHTNLLHKCREDIVQVRRPGWAYTDLLADLLELGVDRLEGRRKACTVPDLQRRAEALRMLQLSAALDLADEATATHGEARLRSLGVRAPRRFAAMLLPGLVDGEPQRPEVAP